METNSEPKRIWHVEVTGWNSDDESVAWDAWGATEDEAIQIARDRGGIIEVGDITTIRRPQ